jgi:2-methylcitrate dehydratase PrpD
VTVPLEVTRLLSEFAAQADGTRIPPPVRHEVSRSVINWMGCALGGAGHEALDTALAAFKLFSTAPQCTVVGRKERVDCPTAALLNGMSAHVLDFDDTHAGTLLHPSVPVASSLLALAEFLGNSGRKLRGERFVEAFVIGADVECRIAKGIYRQHIERAYITGTAGVFGATAAVGRVLGLDADRMAQAFGLAGTQAAGLRAMAGTMAKSFIHGRAAQNGLLSAFMAQAGFTAARNVIEASRGFVDTLIDDVDFEVMLDGLGDRWELVVNTYKPHACGVVAHPVIDICLQVRRQHAVQPEQVASLALRVNPLALKLTGIQAPRGGLESKWSLFHSAAAVLIDGVAGEAQYTDERVADQQVRALRERVSAVADTALGEDEARAVLTLVDGRTLELHVPHALGSLGNPMGDRDLDRKLKALAGGRLPAARLALLIDECWKVGQLDDVARLPRLAAL